MRNLVAKHDRNRAATHLDRSKESQLSVDEGLLDYYAENAENVAQEEYGRCADYLPPGTVIKKSDYPKLARLFMNGEEIKPVTHYTDMVLKREPLSEEDKKHRTLRVELVFTPRPCTELAALLDSLLKR